MQQCDGESNEEKEPFRVLVSAENVAIGRLGHIYKALDRKLGRMLAVECIDLADAVDKSEGSCAPSEVVRRILEDEIIAIGRGDLGRHVLSYDSVHCSHSRIYLRSPSSVIRTLAALPQCSTGFWTTSPFSSEAVYLPGCTRTQHAAQDADESIFTVGHITVLQLSLSSLLLCGGNIVKIAAWFPPVATVKKIQSLNILVGAQFRRSSFGLPLSTDLEALDVRSVAYVMLEMLTGLRARGALMEKHNLLANVQANSSEHQFLCSLLASTPLEEQLAHPYFWSLNPATTTSLNSSSQAAQEQHHVIGVLTKQELTKCQSMKREYLQQIRVWQAQFEKKYQRKPKAADRPAGIVRLQGRCQALIERMQELNDRLAIAHASVYQMISSTAEKEVLAIDSSSQRCLPSMLEQVGQEDTILSTINSPGKRSPAQKAFLNRFGGKTKH